MILNSNNTPIKLPSVLRNKCGTHSGYRAHQNKNEYPCNLCKNAESLYAHAQYEKNKENILNRHAAWRTSNLEKNREWNRNYSKTYRVNNPDKVRKTMSRYQKNNPEKVRAISRKRRALKLSNGHFPYTEAQVLDLYGTDCHICNKPIDLTANRLAGQPGWEQGLHIDHVIPIANGGPDTIDNVRPAHGFCNISKGARMSFEPELDPDLFDDDMPEDWDEDILDEEELEEWEEEPDEEE